MPSEQVVAAAAAPTHDSRGRGAEMSELAHAVLCSSLPLVAQLLSAPGADVNAQDNQGRTPLLLACYQGWLDGVLLLLQHGAKKDIKDRNGRLPLHAVTYSQNLSTLAAIVDGSGTAELNAVDDEIMTALHWAAFHGRPGVLTQLLDYRVDAFALDVDRKTALHWAAQNNCVACVDILLRHENAGETLVGMPDVSGKTALVCAAAAGSVDAMRRLSQSKQCDVNSKDNEKRTPLHWAAGVGRAEAVGLLLDLNADPLAVDSCGKTPLDYASNAGHTECCAIMEHGIRRKVIESTTKKWSQKIETAAQALAKAAEMRRDYAGGRRSTAVGVIQSEEKIADMSASNGSVNSTQRLLSDRYRRNESNWSVNLSTLSLQEGGTIKAEADLWSRLGALDEAKPNTTFHPPPNGAVERRRLAPLRVSHQNLAFVASHGQGLDSDTPSSSGSLATLNSLLAPVLPWPAGGDHLERGQRRGTNQRQGGGAQRRSTRASGRGEAGSWDGEAGWRPAAVPVGDDGSWPSVDSLTEKQAHPQRGPLRDGGDGGGTDRVSGETELSCLGAPPAGGDAVTVRMAARSEREDSMANGTTITIKSSEVVSPDKSKTKVSRIKRKIYPSFERPDDMPWAEDDPAEILKYVNEATDSTSL